MFTGGERIGNEQQGKDDNGGEEDREEEVKRSKEWGIEEKKRLERVIRVITECSRLFKRHETSTNSLKQFNGRPCHSVGSQKWEKMNQNDIRFLTMESQGR